MKKTVKKSETKELKELKFKKEGVHIVQLEERLETLVVWRRGEGLFPDGLFR